jgi:LuxR family maltose regulon positive regulatory protein
LAPPTVLQTKLQPPPKREQTVERRRLFELIAPRPNVKLTVVVAPAGCGKTTLLGMWHDAEASGRRVAWVSLDDRDDDPVVFWSHVLEALRRVCPGVGELPFPEALGEARIVQVLLPLLVNALTEQGDVALILDDFHRLSTVAARNGVSWLVEHGPQTFQLILASRSDPPLPLGALRARGQLVEIRAVELGFTPEEAGELLNGRLELGLHPADVNRLVERTEGWPAGLYLAGLSLGGVRDRQQFMSTFGGTSQHVVDFLVPEVLEAHDPGMQELMLRCSILDRMCGPLCDAVLEQEHGAERLRELAHTNLFLVPLDDRGRWYRFHHLFRQLLQVELEDRESGLAATLHRRAYAWHRDHGAQDEAIEHALKAGAFPEAIELISTVSLMTTTVGRHLTVLAWLADFPPEVSREEPRILLMKAWMYSLAGRRVEAAAVIAELERVGWRKRGPLPDGSGSLEASLALLRARFPWGDVGTAFENAHRAAELVSRESVIWPDVSWALGMTCYYRGDRDGADRWFDETVEAGPAHERWPVTASALAYRSLIAGERGRLGDQIRLAARGATVARDRGLAEVRGEVDVAVGVSLRAQGRLEEALPYLERGMAVMWSAGQPLDFVLALIQLAAVLQATDRDEDAAATIEHAMAIVESCPDPGILPERVAALTRPTHARRREDSTPLSDRELVVLRMLNGPLSERDIGRELYLSHNTIHSHTRSIYRKLGVSSRAEAIGRALALGLL